MRALKDIIQDQEEMLQMKDESIKVLSESLGNQKDLSESHKKVVDSLCKELIFTRTSYNRLIKKFMKLDLKENYMSIFQTDLQYLARENREEFNEKFDKVHEENMRLKVVLGKYEDKKKSGIREGKRRVIATNVDEAFVVLTASNDSLKKEINEQKCQLSSLKRDKQELEDENLQIKAELFKLAGLVKAQFYGSLKQNMKRLNEIRGTQSTANPEVDNFQDESINWGSIANIEEKLPEIQFPGMELDLDGFPGVDARDREDILKKGPSEPLLLQHIATAAHGDENANGPSVARLIRNYKRVIYQNRLLTEALTKLHEIFKKQHMEKQKAKIQEKRVSRFKRSGSATLQKNKGSQEETPKIDSRKPVLKPLKLEKSNQKGNSEARGSSQSRNEILKKRPKKAKIHPELEVGETEESLTLKEAKKLLRNINSQMKIYFEKLVQRIVSPCPLIRYDERDFCSFNVKNQRSVSCHL